MEPVCLLYGQQSPSRDKQRLGWGHKSHRRGGKSDGRCHGPSAQSHEALACSYHTVTICTPWLSTPPDRLFWCLAESVGFVRTYSPLQLVFSSLNDLGQRLMFWSIKHAVESYLLNNKLWLMRLHAGCTVCQRFSSSSLSAGGSPDMSLVPLKVSPS